MEAINNLLQKLEPVIGRNECQEWWFTYVAEDSKGRAEIEQLLRLQAAKSIGLGYEVDATLLPPPPKNVSFKGMYHIGKVLYGAKQLYSFNLKEKEWLSHILIVGRSGAGKTNMVFRLINELIFHKKPFWVFDFKRNYRDLLGFPIAHLLCYTVGRNVANITNFNPLVPIGNAHQHIRHVVSMICKAYYLGEGAYSLLVSGIDKLYSGFGVYSGEVEKYPTLRNLQSWLESYKPQSGARDGQWRISTLRAIRMLNFGPMGKAINSQRAFPLKEFLGKKIIFELDALNKHDKIFFISLLLYYRHQYKLANAQREKLQDVLIIEEAHHLLPKKSAGEQESILEKVLREERELGTSLVIVDQMASRLSDVAFANTATTIALNQKHRADMNTVANAVLLNSEEKKNLSKLKVGQAIVRQQERWAKPFLIKIPEFKLTKGVINDEDVRKHMKIGDRTKPATIQKNKEENEELPLLDEDSVKLLRSIEQYPSFSISQHYTNTGINPRVGNEIKNNLLQEELIRQTTIKTEQGMKRLVQLTKKGALFLRLQTKQETKTSNAGSEHEYYKIEMAKKIEAEGHSIQIESSLDDGSRPDILIENKIAVEIETGKSKHWLKHIVTHIASGRDVMVACTNKPTYEKIVAKLKELGFYPHQKVRVMIPKI